MSTNLGREVTGTARGERRDRAELRAIAEGAEEMFGALPPPPPEDAIEVLEWAVEEFGDRIAVACSLAADTVLVDLVARARPRDRKRTRLHSSHVPISYAVFCS